MKVPFLRGDRPLRCYRLSKVSQRGLVDIGRYGTLAWFRVLLTEGREFEVEAGTFRFTTDHGGPFIEFSKEGPVSANKDHVASLVRVSELSAIRQIAEPTTPLPIR